MIENEMYASVSEIIISSAEKGLIPGEIKDVRL